MPIQGLIGLGNTILKEAGVPGAAEAATMFFAGSWETDFGSTGVNTYGTHTQHIFGTDNRLLVGGPISGLFPIIGIYINEFGGPFKWLGAGDDLRLSYGSAVDTVYGGPRSQVTRGPTISKRTFRPLGAKYWQPPPGTSRGAKIGAAIARIFSGEVSELLAGNHPKLPNPEQGETVPDAFTPELDGKYELLILLLSQLTLLLTAASDLAVRFAYPEYNPQYDARDPDKPIPAPPGIVLAVTGIVTSILQAVIFNFELAATYEVALRDAQSQATVEVDKVARLTRSNTVSLLVPLCEGELQSAADKILAAVTDTAVFGTAVTTLAFAAAP